MRWSSERCARGLAGLLAVSVVVFTPAVLAAEAPAPRYTYLGAGYEWGGKKCAFVAEGTSLSGYDVEGSVGLFKYVHLIGSYYDGETSGQPDDVPDNTGKVDGQCYEVGAGLNYRFAERADLVVRAYYAHVNIDDLDVTKDGLEPEVAFRYQMSDRAEINVGAAYYALGSGYDDLEVRVHLLYHVLPWLAVRAGGVVFDSSSVLQLGLRADFDGNLF